MMAHQKKGKETGPEDWARFRKLLDEQHTWPTEYLFKFVAPAARVDDLKAIFGQVPVRVKSSRTGRYISVTTRLLIHTADEVVAIYEAAGKIPGVIAL
jgi:putative lipoic acid-binding regulatory protein